MEISSIHNIWFYWFTYKKIQIYQFPLAEASGQRVSCPDNLWEASLNMGQYGYIFLMFSLYIHYTLKTINKVLFNHFVAKIRHYISAANVHA